VAQLRVTVQMVEEELYDAQQESAGQVRAADACACDHPAAVFDAALAQVQYDTVKTESGELRRQLEQVNRRVSRQLRQLEKIDKMVRRLSTPPLPQQGVLRTPVMPTRVATKAAPMFANSPLDLTATEALIDVSGAAANLPTSSSLANIAKVDGSTLALYTNLEAAAELAPPPPEKVAQLTEAFERIDKDSDGAATR
jgi:hypothetical protein